MRSDAWLARGPVDAFSRPGDLLLGERYRVVRQVPSCSLCQIFVVADIVSDHRALVCMLPATGATEIAERVAQLAALEHPLLPDIREYILRDDRLLLITQSELALSLLSYLRDLPASRVDERTVITWGIQIASGLSLLHSQRPPLLVADLAPAAYFLTPSRQLRLLSLGPLLGLFSQAGLVGALEPAYAAPEVYSGCLHERSDVFALGALLFRLATGIEPLPNMTDSLAMTALMQRHVASDLAEIIARALAPDPDHRWQSAGEMEAALQHVTREVSEQEPLCAVPGRLAAPQLTMVAGPAIAVTGPLGSADDAQAPPTVQRDSSAATVIAPPRSQGPLTPPAAQVGEPATKLAVEARGLRARFGSLLHSAARGRTRTRS